MSRHRNKRMKAIIGEDKAKGPINEDFFNSSSNIGTTPASGTGAAQGRVVCDPPEPVVKENELFVVMCESIDTDFLPSLDCCCDSMTEAKAVITQNVERDREGMLNSIWHKHLTSLSSRTYFIHKVVVKGNPLSRTPLFPSISNVVETSHTCRCCFQAPKKDGCNYKIYYDKNGEGVSASILCSTCFISGKFLEVPRESMMERLS